MKSRFALRIFLIFSFFFCRNKSNSVRRCSNESSNKFSQHFLLKEKLPKIEIKKEILKIFVFYIFILISTENGEAEEVKNQTKTFLWRFGGRVYECDHPKQKQFVVWEIADVGFDNLLMLFYRKAWKTLIRSFSHTCKDFTDFTVDGKSTRRISWPINRLARHNFLGNRDAI